MIVRIIIGLVILSQGLAMFGDLALAGFVDRNPGLLIALNPRNRNLVLATNQLDAVTYYSIGFVRLVASDPLYYLLGYWYGDRALDWIERRSRTYGPFVRDGEKFFRRASYPLIFASPNNIICALSAATGVKLRTFIILNITGTIARLVLIRQLGEVLESPIQNVVDFIVRYRTQFLIVSAIAVAWTIFGEFRSDNSELKMLGELAGEDDDDAAEGETGSEADANGDRTADSADSGDDPQAERRLTPDD